MSTNRRARFLVALYGLVSFNAALLTYLPQPEPILTSNSHSLAAKPVSAKFASIPILPTPAPARVQPKRRTVSVRSEPIVERPVPLAKDSEVRAIYLTGWTAGSAWGVDLIRRWKAGGGNAICFDVKDMDGLVNIPFDHPLAPRGRRPLLRNLPKFVRSLHKQGLHVIARIALFRDEHMARQHAEFAVQSRRTKGPWRENGKRVWADPSRREVQEYNLALARHAAASGVDEIQFDYVRFPAEGDQQDAQFFFQSDQPGTTRADVIAGFLKRAYNELHPLGVLVSLDVFGVMAWERRVDLAHTGQNIAEMARYCDVLSPMIYPSHFFGMDGYERPGDAPEHFIGSSMERFRQITAGSGVILRPWLQAFGWRTKAYSPDYVLTQVRVAEQKGGVGYLFWNANNNYSKPLAAMPALMKIGRQKEGEKLEEKEQVAAVEIKSAGLSSDQPPGQTSTVSPARETTQDGVSIDF